MPFHVEATITKSELLSLSDLDLAGVLGQYGGIFNRESVSEACWIVRLKQFLLGSHMQVWAHLERFTFK
jgi:hypothetical protein